MAPPGLGGTMDTALFTCSTVPWKCGVTLGRYEPLQDILTWV